MSGIGQVSLDLLVNTTKWREGWQQAVGISDKQMQVIQDRAASIGKGLTVAFTTAAAGLTALTVSAINAADGMNDLAQKTGVSTEKLSALQLIAKQSGADINVLGNGLAKLAKSASDAAQGAAQQKQAFAAIGVSVLDSNGKLKSTSELLDQVAKKFAGYKDDAAKAALAQALFGKSGTELIPALNSIGQGTEEATKYVKAFGAEISTATAHSADAFNDKMEVLKLGLSGFGNSVASKVLPALNELADKLIGTATKGDGLKKLGEKIGDGLAYAIRNIDSIIENIKRFGEVVATIYASKLILSGQQWIESLAKQRAAAAASGEAQAASIGLLQKSLGVAIAGVAGWNIGTYLREKFQVVADAGAYLVYGLSKAWEALKFGTQSAFLNIVKTVADSVQAVRDKIADLIDGFVSLAQVKLPFGQTADFTYGSAEKLAAVADGLRQTTDTAKATDAALASLNKQWEDSAKANDDMLAIMLDQSAWDHAEHNVKGTADSVKGIANAAQEAAPTLKDLSKIKVDDTAIKALEQLIKLVQQYQTELDDLQRQLAGETSAQIAFEHAIIAAADAYQKAGGAANAAAQKAFEKAVALAKQAKEATDELQKQANDASVVDTAQHIAEALDNNPFKKQLDDIDKLQAAIDIVGNKLSKAYDPEKLKGFLAAQEKARMSISIGVVGAAEQAVRGIQTLAKQGSKEFAALEIAADSLAVTQAILSIITASTLPPPAGFVTMAAMAASIIPLLAQIGQSINVLFGSGPSAWEAQTAASRQASQGTGTVLGDVTKQSESIAKAMDITASATSKLVGINTGMLRALQTLQQALGAAGTQLAHGAGNATFPGVGGGGFNLDPFGGDPLTGAISNFLFGGKKKVIDQGIVIAASTLGDMLNQIVVGAYQTIHKSGGLFSSGKTYDQTADVSDAFTKQFQLVIGSIADAVREGAKALGILPDQIEAAIAAFKIAETHISLEGLSAEDQQKAIEAVFSSIFDGLAGAVVPFIGQFQKVGEGLGETLVRVATEVQVMQEAVKQLGLSVSVTDPEKFAQIADGLVNMVGGIDAFITGMQSFTDKFAPDSVKRQLQFDALTSAFDQVGLVLPATREGMYELMKSLDATTQAGQEQIAALLRLTDVADAYYSGLEKQGAAMQSYLDFIAKFDPATQSLSQFEKAMQDVGASLAANIAKANELAKANGLAGASAQDIGKIISASISQGVAAVQALEQEAAQLAQTLFGVNYQDQISALQTRIEKEKADFAAGSLMAHAFMLNDQKQLDALQAQYDAQQAAAKKQQDFMQAAQLLGDLGQISAVSGQSLADFAKMFPTAIPLDKFASMLGTDQAGLAKEFDQQVKLANAALETNSILEQIRDILSGKTPSASVNDIYGDVTGNPIASPAIGNKTTPISATGGPQANGKVTPTGNAGDPVTVTTPDTTTAITKQTDAQKTDAQITHDLLRQLIARLDMADRYIPPRNTRAMS